MIPNLSRLCLIVALLASAACDPTVARMIAISPQPSPIRDSVALALAAAVASDHGMSRNRHVEEGEHWLECYSRGSLSFCSQHMGMELQFALIQSGRNWSSCADSVETALLGALRSTYGESVRQCTWEYIDRYRQYGCALRAQTDST